MSYNRQIETCYPPETLRGHLPRTKPTLVFLLLISLNTTLTQASAVSVRGSVEAGQFESRIMSVYQRASRGVVNITTRTLNYDSYQSINPQKGNGSGFVFDKRGHIVTNYHVVKDSDTIQVTFHDGFVQSAWIVGTDPSNDLAVLRVKTMPSGVRHLRLSSSNELQVGRVVLTIGNPFGLGGSLTMGVVSAMERIIKSPDDRYIGGMIQTDAPINPGSSGGPLLDLQGWVVGVTSANIGLQHRATGIGFAIPARTVKRVTRQLIKYGRYRHPWLGLKFYDLLASQANILKKMGYYVPSRGGIVVVDMVSGSPAAQAGLHGSQKVVAIGNRRLPVGGDVITAFNGRPVYNYKQLLILLETSTEVGSQATLTVFRDGRKRNIQITIGVRPASR